MSLRFTVLMIYSLLNLSLLTNHLQGQIFQHFTPPPPPPAPGMGDATNSHLQLPQAFLLDTAYLIWEPEDVQELPADSIISWEIQRPNYSHGLCAKNDKYIGITATETIYQDGSTSDSKLHLDIYDLTGKAVGHFTLSHPPGIGAEAITCDGENFYLAYEKSINSGDRDLYVAKISPRGQLQWATKVGKRFGTSGSEILQIDPQGRVVLFAQMYTEVGFDILSPQGEIVDRKMLYFHDEFSPASFFYQQDGTIVAFGTHQSYPNRQSETHAVLFTMSPNYQVLQYRPIKSPYTDQALYVTTDDQGNYYCLLNSLNYQAPYNQRAKFSTIIKLDEQLEVVDKIQFKNPQMGSKLQLQWHPTQGLWAYQRLYLKGQTFALFQLSADLSVENIWSKKGNFSDPHFLNVGDDRIYLGGGSRNSWLLRLPFSVNN